MSLLHNYKTQGVFHNKEKDEIYFKENEFACHLCLGNKSGRPKIFSCLYKLRYHYSYYHKDHCRDEWQSYIKNIEELIRRGVLR